MNKYEVLVHRSIGEVYKFEVEAESAEDAEETIEDKLQEGDLEFELSNLKYSEITEEFISECNLIKTNPA